MDAVNRSFVDLDNIDQRKLVIIQAVWRGTLVRKWMHSQRRLFEEICAEIDKKHASNIHWTRDSLCYPSFDKPYHKTEKLKQNYENSARSKREKNRACIHCPTYNSEQRNAIKACSHCPVSDSKQRTVCDRGTDPQRDDMIPSKLNSDDSVLANRNSSCKTTDDWSAQTVPMTTECVESSANNPVASSCHGDEESGVNLTSNIQNREVSCPELRADNEQTEHHTEQDFEADCYPSDRGELLKMRKNIAMELLWVQQAIHSRKNYLNLKAGMQ